MGFGGIVFRAFGVARCKIGHGKTAVIGFAVETAVNFMVAAVAGGRGSDSGGHLNPGEGRPLRGHSPGFNFPRFAHLAHKHVVVDDKGQHTVRRGLIEHLPAAGGAEAKAGIVGKFCILFRELSVTVALVDTGGIGRYPPRPALHQHIGVWHGLEPLQCGHGRGFGRPEGMVIRQSKQQKALHAPVGTAGGVVPLGHVHLRVAVADGQDAVPVEHFLPQPPVEVADDEPFHHRQGQRLQPCPDAGRPEAVLGKAVGQAAAKGQGCAVGIEPIDELLREQLGALAVECSTPGVGVGGKFRVEQSVILDGPRDVVILLHGGAIGGPAVAAVIAVNFAKAILQQFRAVRHPHAFQGKVYKDAEKLPVAVRDGVGVDLPQPCGKVLFFGIRKRGPQLFRCGEDAAGNSRHLHITLVVFPGGAPVFGVFRVGAGGKTLAVDFFKLRVRAAAHPEGHQRPQRAAEGFQLNGILVVGHTRLAQMQPGAACGITGLEGVEKFVHQCGKIRFGLQVHHQYISQSLVRRVSASM